MYPHLRRSASQECVRSASSGCAATQVLFPWAYDALLALQPAAVALLLGRNLLEVVLFVWIAARLVAVPTAVRVPAGDPRPATPEGSP